MADFYKQKVKFSGNKKQVSELKNMLKKKQLLQSLRPMPKELNFESHDGCLEDAVKLQRQRMSGQITDLLDFEMKNALQRKKEYPDLYKQYKSNYKKYGYVTWYDWRCDNWDTKWDAKINKIGETYFIFSCAWIVPQWIIPELSKKFPLIKFDAVKK